ncbi:MAG: helix-turn-helix domain-containing protein [Brachybacterium sp.]|nr:helix-turn-helix domain-containing protein [Brachybacterium sp.]MDN5687780.1 helix-turn-helix domain-containing protein [Brachybacterium sp.]
MGGTRDESINSPANLVLLCQACHGWVETFRTEAREQGWLVSQHADPRYQPIDHEGRLTFLTADGKAVPETTTNHHEGDHLMSRKPSTTGTEAMTVEEARQLLGIGRNQAYEAVRRGDIPSLRIGDRILVPRRRLMALINGDVEEPDRG